MGARAMVFPEVMRYGHGLADLCPYRPAHRVTRTSNHAGIDSHGSTVLLGRLHINVSII